MNLMTSWTSVSEPDKSDPSGINTGPSICFSVPIGEPRQVVAAGASQDAVEGEIRCGRFRLLPHCRVLLRDGQHIEVGGRAFDLMQVLMESAGAVVSKAEIIRRVWPATLVEEGNLRFQVAALRKALGEDGDLIKAVRGRGYLLAAEVAKGEPEGRAAQSTAPSEGADPYDRLLTLVGSVLDELLRMKQQTR